MARTAAELNAARAALLLRCQRVREERGRRSVTRADLAVAAALAAVRAAVAASAADRLRRPGQLDALHRAVRGRVLDHIALAALGDLEDGILVQARRCAAAEARAEADLAATRGLLDAARAELAAETRRSAKRARLASERAAIRQREIEVLAEAEREDAIVETWRRA